MTNQLTPILPSSKHTFEWYTENLVRLRYYNLDKPDFDKLTRALTDIQNIIDKLPVSEAENE